MAHQPDQARIDAAYDALDNWYDEALKAGCGFKSDTERDEYIKSIGDPMKHPLFAETTEDMEGHPLTEAIRQIKEEDKSLVELSAMYKDEGNDFLRQGNNPNSVGAAAIERAGTVNAFRKNAYLSAIDRYTHAMTFLDQAEAARKEGTESEADAAVDLAMSRSQLWSNRALANMNLGNYGTCVKDCDLSIHLAPTNTKAHLRKCKALLKLKRYEECIAACDAAALTCNIDLSTSSSNHSTNDTGTVSAVCSAGGGGAGKAADTASARNTTARDLSDMRAQRNTTARDLSDMRAQSEELLSCLRAEARRTQNRQVQQLTRRWGAVWDLACRHGVCLGYASSLFPEPLQLRDIWPSSSLSSGAVTSDSSQSSLGTSMNANEEACSWPVLLRYPQYGMFDVLESVSGEEMLVNIICGIFPELEDLPQGRAHAGAVEWDTAAEYVGSELDVYLQLQTVPPAQTAAEWQRACLEYYVLQQSGDVGIYSAIEQHIAETFPSPTTESRSQVPSESGRESSANPVPLPPVPPTPTACTSVNFERIKARADAREKAFTSGPASSSAARSATQLDGSTFLNVHLGCTFDCIARANSANGSMLIKAVEGAGTAEDPELQYVPCPTRAAFSHVLPRGLVVLTVYPRSSLAHLRFLQHVREEQGEIFTLAPAAV